MTHRRKQIATLLVAIGTALVLTGASQATAGTNTAATTAQRAAGTIPRPGTTALAETFNIHNGNAFGKCIGISTGLAGDWNCTNNTDQTWHWGAPISGNWFQLINGNGQCLAVNGASTKSGTRILGYPCVGSADQYWTLFDSPGGGFSYLVNYKGWLTADTMGKIVGVAGGSTNDGAPLVLWQPEDHPDQFWS